MKFFSVLSVASCAIAAPTFLESVVTSVVNGVPANVGETVNGLTGRGLDLSVVGLDVGETVKDLKVGEAVSGLTGRGVDLSVLGLNVGETVKDLKVGEAVSGLTGRGVDLSVLGLNVGETVKDLKVGEAVSGLTERGLDLSVVKINSVVSLVSGSVSVLQQTISPDLKYLTSITGKVQSTAVLVNTLDNIKVALNTTVAAVATIVNVAIVPLVLNEVKDVLITVEDVLEIVEGILAGLTHLVGSIEADALILVKAEVLAIVGLINPIVNPITGFAYSVVGSLTGTDGSQLRNEVNSVVAVAAQLTSPTGPILHSLML